MSFRIAMSDSPDARPFVERLDIQVDHISPIPETEEACIRMLKGYQAVIALNETFSKKVLQALAPELKIVARFGLGYDKVDVESARELGICVTNAAGTMAGGVAETAILLMLEAARRFPQYNAEMHHGIWKKEFSGTQLEGKTVGIVGFGSIGRKLAQYCQGFHCETLTYDPYCRPEDLQLYGTKQVSLEELAKMSDYISVHCPLLPKTRHIIDETFFRNMKPSAILVNTSRGPTVDEEALAEALVHGRIAGAGLDVYETEPLPETSPLRGLDSVVLLPHIASFTKESMMECALDVERSICDVRSGRVPVNCLDPAYKAD